MGKVYLHVYKFNIMNGDLNARPTRCALSTNTLNLLLFDIGWLVGKYFILCD